MLTLAYSYLRFSSTEQKKGNSFDRPIRGRDAYVAKKGLTLDSSFIIEDAGVSAFRGMNAATGALRDFLNACEKKRIRPGSVLIVENLDRLSRDETLDAVTLFLCILNHGITLVTLFPEQEFSKATLDMPRLSWPFLNFVVVTARALPRASGPAVIGINGVAISPTKSLPDASRRGSIFRKASSSSTRRRRRRFDVSSTWP